MLLKFTHRTQNEIIVDYVLYLLSGHTLLARSIRVDAAKAYNKAVSDYFKRNQQFSPALDKTGAIPSDLDKVYKEAKS